MSNAEELRAKILEMAGEYAKLVFQKENAMLNHTINSLQEIF